MKYNLDIGIKVGKIEKIEKLVNKIICEINVLRTKEKNIFKIFN